MTGKLHPLPIADRADHYRERAARARAAAEFAVEPLARSSLLHVATAWEDLAGLCDRTEEPPSVLEVADLVERLRDLRQDEAP